MKKFFVTAPDHVQNEDIISAIPGVFVADWTNEDLSSVAPLVWLSDGGIGPEPSGVPELLDSRR